jgi:hypothetical protein
MLNEIARVFSSQGVLIPGSEAVPVSGRQPGARPACDHKGPDCRCFGPKFAQAAAKLEISARGRALQAASAAGNGDEASGPDQPSAAADGKGSDGKPLSADEEKQIHELEKRDREVKAHEAAHQASAGGQARGGANFDYQAGPDGKRYAVGGHVDIDVSPVEGNPRATLAKAMTAQRAALAPADPSGQDRAVAAAAAQVAMQAQKELASGKGDPGQGGPENGGGTENAGGTARSASQRAYRRQPATGAALSVYA